MISPRRGTARIRIDRHAEHGSRERRDVVAVEEPMEIRVDAAGPAGREEHRVAVTMRTPGDDFELALGFLHGEGLVTSREAVAEVKYCTGEEPQAYNIVSVFLREGARFDPGDLDRNFYTTSSCGVCGKASLEAVEIRGCSNLPVEPWRLGSDVVRSIPDALRDAQPVFERTGGIHAAGIFTPAGELELLREDVGRHNAVDKAVGHLFLEDGLPATDRVLAVSGRASFEILQKALAAGLSTVIAVGAPSSLAVDVARRFDMTLIGFTKSDGFNVYHDPGRLAGYAPAARESEEGT